MAKRKIAPGEQLKRQGDFWQEGDTFTEKAPALLQILKERAQALGNTPLVSEMPEACAIKGRFRCWRDALIAAGLPSEKSAEQAALRMAARLSGENSPETNQPG